MRLEIVILHSLLQQKFWIYFQRSDTIRGDCQLNLVLAFELLVGGIQIVNAHLQNSDIRL